MAFLCLAGILSAQERIDQINPDRVVEGGPGFSLQVLGQGFGPLVQVTLDGSPIDTSYVSNGELTAQVPASAIQTAKDIQVGLIESLSRVVAGTVRLRVLPRTSGAAPNSGSSGDPVSTATGELYQTVVDLSLGGPLPLRFERQYGSRLSAGAAKSTLGTNWNSNFGDIHLNVNQSFAEVTLFPYRRIAFKQSGGVWQTFQPELFNYQLAAVAGGYAVLDASQNLIYSFTTLGVLTSIADRSGNKLTISSPGAAPTQVSDGLGRSLAFTYAGGKLTRVEDQSGRAVSYAYSGDDLVSFTDANGKVTRYSYTATGGLTSLLTSTVLPNGDKPFTQEFDAKGRVAKQTDSQGNATVIQYDQPAAGVTTVTNALAAVSQQTHQGPANLTAYLDPAGQGGVYAYDGAGRRSSIQDRLGDAIRYTYHVPSGKIASQTDAAGNATRFSYTAQAQGPFTYYNLTRIDYADGTALALTYDESGHATAISDQAGKRWVYSFDSHGQVLTAANPSGGVTSYTYNSDATLASIKSAAGDVTAFSFDNKKRVTFASFPDGTSATYVYDNLDNLLQVTRGGNQATNTTNDNGRIVARTDYANKSTGITYDPDQRPVAVTAPTGKRTNVGFDSVGRMKTITTPGGDDLNLTFDANNRLTGLADCTGKGVNFTYDKEGVLTSVIDGLGRAWTLTSDKNGKITRIASPLGRTFSYGYDPLGRLAAFTNPLGQAVRYQRDGRGQVTGISQGGVSAALTRDGLGQVTDATDPAGNLVRRTYDAQGRLVSAIDPAGRTVSYVYDARNRVSKMTLPDGSVTYTYNAAGAIVRSAYSDGLTLNFTRDANARILRAEGVTLGYDDLGSIVESNGLIITRDDNSRIETITYASGKSVRYTYDCRDLLTQVTDWVGGTTNLSYDGARQLTSVRRPNGVTTQYSYDQDGRLTGITESQQNALASIALQRDAAGNIISAARNVPQPAVPAPGLLQLGYDSAGRISGASYDGEGRPLTLAGRTYQWDLASRLSSYAGLDGSATFTYDGLGTRISRSVGGARQDYVLNYGLDLASVSVVRENSADRRYYVYLPDGTLLYSIEAAGNARHFYHYDETGSTQFLTDDAGSITDSYGVGPYGEEAAHSGATENPFTYLGAYGVMQEGNTGLYYMRLRYYDSTAARFLSRDPLPQFELRAANLYQYAMQNPLSFIDPMGRGATAGSRRNKAEGGDFSRFVFALPERLSARIGPGTAGLPLLIRILDAVTAKSGK